MKKFFYFFISLLLTPILASTALAVMTLDINRNNVYIGNIRIPNFNAGFIQETNAVTVNAKSTKDDWKLFVKTNNNDMGTIGTYVKPISDFQWQATGSSATQTTFISIANFDIEVARGIRSGQKNQIPIDYQVLLAWENDVPGSYELSLLFTITTQ